MKRIGLEGLGRFTGLIMPLIPVLAMVSKLDVLSLMGAVVSPS